MRNKQIIIKLSDDTNLSILQGRDANSTDDTVEFWDKVSDDVTGYADGKKTLRISEKLL